MITNKDKRKVKRYINKSLKNGASKEQIRGVLKGIKWPDEVIDEIFDDIENKPKTKIKFVVEKEPKTVEEEPQEERKSFSLRDQMAELEKKMDLVISTGRTKRGKPFKLPFKTRSQLRTLAKKGKLMVFYLGNNRNLNVTTGKIQRGGVEVDGKWRNCSLDFVFLYEGKYPAIVLPQWDINPIGTKDYYDAVKEGRTPDPQDVVIRMMENLANQEKKKLSPKMWFIILMVAAAAAYVLFGNG